MDSWLTWIVVISLFNCVLGQKVEAPENPWNLAPDVDEDYPVIFNILLFLGISFFIALLAICVAIATMDPGSESLIYRVTSGQRFKKDN